jgi:hypothetical protein
MQSKKLTVLCQFAVSCSLWFFGLQMMHSVATAQKEAETYPDNTTVKTKKAKKSKKAKASEVTSSPTSTPAEAEKTMKSKKANRAMPEATTPPPITTPSGAPAKATRSPRMRTTEGTPSSGSAARAQSESSTMPSAPVKNASPRQIQAAKSSGKVWVNTDSGIYHKGGQWYGATKQGKFMTEQEAVQAGYRPAKNE